MTADEVLSVFLWKMSYFAQTDVGRSLPDLNVRARCIW